MVRVNVDHMGKSDLVLIQFSLRPESWRELNSWPEVLIWCAGAHRSLLSQLKWAKVFRITKTHWLQWWWEIPRMNSSTNASAGTLTPRVSPSSSGWGLKRDLQSLASTPRDVPQNKCQQQIPFWASYLKVRLKQSPTSSLTFAHPTDSATWVYILRVLIAFSPENQKTKAHSINTLC